MLEVITPISAFAISLPVMVIAILLKRQNATQADMQLTLERIANLMENPPEHIAEAPESIARRLEEEGQRMATLLGEALEQVRAERAARREARNRGEEPDA